MVPIVKVRKQKSTEEVSIPAQYQLSGPGADFSFLVQVICTHLTSDTYRQYRHPKFQLGKQRYKRIKEAKLKKRKNHANKKQSIVLIIRLKISLQTLTVTGCYLLQTWRNCLLAISQFFILTACPQSETQQYQFYFILKEGQTTRT